VARITSLSAANVASALSAVCPAAPPPGAGGWAWSGPRHIPPAARPAKDLLTLFKMFVHVMDVFRLRLTQWFGLLRIFRAGWRAHPRLNSYSEYASGNLSRLARIGNLPDQLAQLARFDPFSPTCLTF